MIKEEDLKPEDILQLMDIYQNEWLHRDNGFYTQAFRFFYVALIMIFLPNLTDRLGFKFNNEELLKICSPIIGVIMCMVFLYVLLSNISRLKAVNQSYIKLNSQLPDDFQRIKVKEVSVIKKNDGKYFMTQTTTFLSIMMFGSLSILGILILADNLFSILQ